MATKFTLAPRALALILLGVLGCGSDLLLPDPPGGENVLLSKVGGDNQDGVVGERLQEPLVVQVKTGRGLAAIEREVEFVFTDAAGVVTPSRAITNSLDLRLTLKVFLDKLIHQLRVDAASVFLFNAASQTLTYAAGQGFHTHGLKLIRLRLGEGYAGRAALES